MLSAPLVAEASDELRLSPERRTLLNFWFRHVWEYTLPTFPAVFLTAGITGVPIPELVAAGAPLTLAAIAAGVLFGFVLTYYRVPQQFTELFLSFDLSPYTVLMIVILFYIILGMFLEPVSMTFITLPTIYPLMSAAGFDLIWFGVVYTITMEIAVLTPPVGLNLYVIQAISRDQVSIGDVIIGCLPFIGAMVLLIGILIAAPDVALWLPEQMQ